MKYENHELAELFPMMCDADVNALAADIKENGQQLSIVIYEGKILDGRNRYKACQLLGIDPMEKPFKGKDPLKFVVSSNLSRRHLSQTEKAIVAEKIATMKSGHRSDLAQPLREVSEQPVSLVKAAEMMGVGKKTVSTVRQVKSQSPEVYDKLSKGQVTLREARSEIKASPSRKEYKDALGVVLPSELAVTWVKKSEVQALVTELLKIKGVVTDCIERNDILFCGRTGVPPLNKQSFMSHLEQAIADLKVVLPAYVCPSCQGDVNGCKLCSGIGLLSGLRYKNAVPEELKA